MQQPTCTDVRIRSMADAHKVFIAVQQGILHMVTRRLDADERTALRSGCIYAWEERGPQTENTGLGIERFTEGRRWSPSRVRDEFLFYYEKYSPPPDLNNPGAKSTDVKPPRDWDPLVKQTYSVWVETERGRRKWHLTAYFTQSTIDQLNTIDDDPRIRNIVIPEGMFKSTRISKNRTRTDDSKNSDMFRTIASRSYAAYPTPYQSQSQKPSSNLTPVFMHEPYQANYSPESHTPPYESPHSSLSPQNGDQHAQNEVPYPEQIASQPYSSNYHHISTTLSPFGPSSETSSASPHEAPNYYSLPTQRLAEVGVPSSQLSSPLPPMITLVNQVDNHDGPFGYAHPFPASMQNSNATHLYSAPSPLNSGYTPLRTPPAPVLPDMAESRGGHLLIQDKPHGVSYSQASPISPVVAQNGPDYGDGLAPALAPLNDIKRPIRYRRDPQDELILRLLRASQSSR